MRALASNAKYSSTDKEACTVTPIPPGTGRQGKLLKSVRGPMAKAAVKASTADRRHAAAQAPSLEELMEKRVSTIEKLAVPREAGCESMKAAIKQKAQFRYTCGQATQKEGH